ncbi:DNA-processing protein DprA [Flavilitoribacter nigricans]|uniref:DNA-protecting protein DprA n=1 Tax=Flavilitoribacter nigricans (strain ATCC 23147 / DSM 23189 / NBRC 102662 / NCIMB 1420 / SS-2) TaxID=1122177 RepID=A0A2D0NFA1_FLAN2|nr:DNA-processing protein DprA [Flavilitoribacter nigricans]PHN07172.1 DNA-protecting protein DprA [Flavilitoribacter nigricans DSM 23189 = NBRC 102662]
MSDLLYKIGLTQIPNVGPVLARQLVAYCGSPQAVFEARRKELLQIPGIGVQTAAGVLNKEALLAAERECRFVEQFDIRPLFYLDPAFPTRLKHLSDAPILLYYRGNADLNHPRTVAIVGTRQPSPQGIRSCEQLVEELRGYGVQIISGLAYGIDICAHRQCLEVGIPTIGVLGHGLGRIYPAQHRQIAEKMSMEGGLLTEFTSGTAPEREHFPMRNRIVAGLCDALVVVETARKGGSMITAYMANDYHRDVFAFPGRARDHNVQGCNLLIKSHRAALIEQAADIAYVMRWEEPDQSQPKQTQLFVELTEEEKLIVNLLQEHEGIDIDHLTFASQLKGSTLAGLLLNLEFKGMIKTLPGKRYTLI